MKAKIKFKKLFGDGLALALPLAIGVYVIVKIIARFEKLLDPLAQRFGIERLFGELTLTVLALVLFLLIILLLGFLMNFTFVNRISNLLENFALHVFPPLNQLKTLLVQRLDLENEATFWKSVLLYHGKKYSFAYLVEESADTGVFFLVKDNTISNGDTLILPRTEYSYTAIEANVMRGCLKHNGKGATKIIDKK